MRNRSLLAGLLLVICSMLPTVPAGAVTRAAREVTVAGEGWSDPITIGRGRPGDTTVLESGEVVILVHRREQESILVGDPLAGTWFEQVEYTDGRYVDPHWHELVHLPDGTVALVYLAEDSELDDRHTFILRHIRMDGTVGPIRAAPLPPDIDLDFNRPFYVSATGKRTVNVATYDRDDPTHTPIVLRSRDMRKWRSVPVPERSPQLGEFVTGLLVGPGREVVVISETDQRVDSHETDGVAWVTQNLGQVSPWSPRWVQPGVGGAGVFEWRDQETGQQFVATRTDGQWAVETLESAATCATRYMYNCAIVDITADDEVVALWLRDGAPGSYDLVFSRRDASTGEWSSPELLDDDTKVEYPGSLRLGPQRQVLASRFYADEAWNLCGPDGPCEVIANPDPYDGFLNALPGGRVLSLSKRPLQFSIYS